MDARTLFGLINPFATGTRQAMAWEYFNQCREAYLELEGPASGLPHAITRLKYDLARRPNNQALKRELAQAERELAEVEPKYERAWAELEQARADLEAEAESVVTELREQRPVEGTQEDEARRRYEKAVNHRLDLERQAVPLLARLDELTRFGFDHGTIRECAALRTRLAALAVSREYALQAERRDLAHLLRLTSADLKQRPLRASLVTL